MPLKKLKTSLTQKEKHKKTSENVASPQALYWTEPAVFPQGPGHHQTHQGGHPPNWPKAAASHKRSCNIRCCGWSFINLKSCLPQGPQHLGKSVPFGWGISWGFCDALTVMPRGQNKTRFFVWFHTKWLMEEEIDSIYWLEVSKPCCFYVQSN